ncbi:MAG: L,D-transpeptidase family protein [Richelia sp. RM2_1_2]|nr:L,D-transpeptidase family protein [Richelia sp. RM2_1_2]
MQFLLSVIMILILTVSANAHPVASALQQELNRLETVNATPLHLSSNKPIKLGSSGNEVLLLTTRLNELGYNITPTSNFTVEVEDVVRLYQHNNSLNVDGIVASQTLFQLNMNTALAKSLIKQSLEELSKINLTGKYIIVNIPSFELIAYEGDQEIFRSKVIVGAPQHKTILMSTNAWAIKYNPDWTAPPGIRARYAKKWSAGERAYFAKHGIRVSTKNGMLHFYQPPKSSYLGKLKIELDNPHNIYLHDTDSREKFNQTTRALSNGCVRVASYQELGAWLNNSTTSEIQNKINTNKTFVEQITSIPVHIVYMMAFPNNDKVSYYQDIYKKF